MQQPSVGRIVHYQSHGTPVRADGTQEYQGACRAAVVTVVHPEEYMGAPIIGVAVLNPEGIYFAPAIGYGDNHESGTWHWPERVE